MGRQHSRIRVLRSKMGLAKTSYSTRAYLMPSQTKRKNSRSRLMVGRNPMYHSALSSLITLWGAPVTPKNSSIGEGKQRASPALRRRTATRTKSCRSIRIAALSRLKLGKECSKKKTKAKLPTRTTTQKIRTTRRNSMHPNTIRRIPSTF